MTGYKKKILVKRRFWEVKRQRLISQSGKQKLCQQIQLWKMFRAQFLNIKLLKLPVALYVQCIKPIRELWARARYGFFLNCCTAVYFFLTDSPDSVQVLVLGSKALLTLVVSIHPRDGECSWVDGCRQANQIIFHQSRKLFLCALVV